MNALHGARRVAQMTAEDRARLVAALDHDVRQPRHSLEMGLRTLRLVTADLMARRFDDTTFDSLVQRLVVETASVQAASRQLTDAQQDLFDALRIEFDELLLRPRIISAGDLVERICRSSRTLAGHVELRGASSRLTFFSDEGWVERVLGNLVTNALRHSCATKVLIGARRCAGDIVFEVRDNGRGLSPEKLADVFQAIKTPSGLQSDLSTVRSGLGLCNVRLLTERLGGSVHCASAPGRGTRFRVRLPGPLGTSEPRLPIPRGTAAQAVRNKLVVVIDDDLAVLRTTERLFEALGVEVFADHDPLRWLGIVTDLTRPPDLVLLDFQLRDHDCSILLDVVRRKWAAPRTKVLVLTGAPEGPGLSEVAASVPVLRKPLTDEKFDLLLGLLAGTRELSATGCLEARDER
jgi:two-component system, sensor histidine kinase